LPRASPRGRFRRAPLAALGRAVSERTLFVVPELPIPTHGPTGTCETANHSTDSGDFDTSVRSSLALCPLRTGDPGGTVRHVLIRMPSPVRRYGRPCGHSAGCVGSHRPAGTSPRSTGSAGLRARHEVETAGLVRTFAPHPVPATDVSRHHKPHASQGHSRLLSETLGNARQHHVGEGELSAPDRVIHAIRDTAGLGPRSAMKRGPEYRDLAEMECPRFLRPRAARK